MSTFFFFGKYSAEAVKEISAKRTERANALIEKNGGKIKSGYALLGKYDLVLIIEFADVNQAIKTSVELAKLLGIGFTTAPAISMEEFDRLVG